MAVRMAVKERKVDGRKLYQKEVAAIRSEMGLSQKEAQRELARRRGLKSEVRDFREEITSLEPGPVLTLSAARPSSVWELSGMKLQELDTKIATSRDTLAAQEAERTQWEAIHKLKQLQPAVS